MTLHNQIRLALAAIGVIVWGYGARFDDPRTRLVGIVLLAVALALRLIPRRFQPGGRGDEPRR